MQKLASKNRCKTAASIALEVKEAEGQLVSAQTIHHTLQQVGLHGRHPRTKSLLKLAHKKACKQFAEDNLAKNMNYWNHVLWSDEIKIHLFGSKMVSSMCDNALVRSTKKIVPCLQSSMVVVASWSRAANIQQLCTAIEEVWTNGPQSTTWSTLCEGYVLHWVRQMVVTPDTDWFSDPLNTVKLHILEWLFIVASLRHTCAIIMLSNQHLNMPHLWGGWIISAKEKCSLTQI